MAIKSLESFISHPVDSVKTYIVDASFLIKSFEKGTQDYLICNSAREFILRSDKLTAVYNTTIRGELLRHLRKVLIASFLNSKNDLFSTEMKDLMGKKKISNLSASDLINNGFIDIFSEALGDLGQHLLEQMKILTEGVVFFSPSHNSKRSKLWVLLPEIMAKFGLDSGDAMILNIALSTKGINGLITADRDFRFCDTGKNFEIFMPERLITGSKKRWSK